MNGLKNRKLLLLLGPVAALVMFAATVKVVTVFVSRSEYREPYRAPAAAADSTPRVEGVAADQAAAEKQSRAKPYVEAEYRTFPIVGSRVAIWMVAQLHLLFAAFVLAVPIFAFIVEAIGYKTGDLRYDQLAYEFTKLLSVSFSLTATFGAFLTFMLIILYPKFTNYLMSVFSPTFLPYVLLFFFEAFFLYTYYYGWGKFHPLVHLGLGLGLNIVGTAIMFIANAWLTFMMSPRGISDTGAAHLRLGCGLQLHVDADQRASRDRQRRVRRIGRRRLRGLQVPAGGRPTRSARTTTGWDTSATSSRSARSCRCPSPATGSRRRSTRTRRRSG